MLSTPEAADDMETLMHLTTRTLLLALALPAVATPLVVTAASSSSAPADAAQGTAHQRCRLPGPYELPHGRERVHLDPDDFSTRINNVYWPMRPGTTWKYRESTADSTSRVRVTVTHRTKRLNGVRARVVHDVVRGNGQLIENTYDYYAQDSGGSLWYLGENTKEYENGEVVSTEGSWEYGTDGAQAGILIPARLRPGCHYRQEQYAGEAEDRGAILSTRESVTVPAGTYRDVLTTSDSTPLEPRLLEHKFYAKHVGPVLAVAVSPHSERQVLLDINRPVRGR